MDDMKSEENYVHETAQIYKDAVVRSSKLMEKSSVGDFSKVENSVLNKYVRIDRNNYIWHSIVGKHSYTGKNTSVISAEIGNFVSVSWNVTIGGANHDYSRVTTHSFLYDDRDALRPEGASGYDRFKAPCIIKNDVWIAANAVILRGITVGNGAVIGAGSVVTKDIPDYAIVVGVPARIIGYRFEENLIHLLNQTCWWNWEDEQIRKNYHLFNQKITADVLEEMRKVSETFSDEREGEAKKNE